VWTVVTILLTRETVTTSTTSFWMKWRVAVIPENARLGRTAGLTRPAVREAGNVALMKLRICAEGFPIPPSATSEITQL